MKWYIGCSGFHYKEWKGIFYPEKLAQKNWFEYYSSQFNTLELNVTFYRFPQLSFLENWHAKSQDDFVFSVKAPRLITHYKQFKESEQLLHDFYDVIEKGLKEKLGPVLFQLPPQFDYTPERLELIINNLNTSFNNVIEFRHASWWQDEIIKTLGKASITFCGISYPKLPLDVIHNTLTPYYRFHGIPKLYYSAYSEKELSKVVKALSSEKKLDKIYIYFNNTATAAAIDNARYVKLIAND